MTNRDQIVDYLNRELHSEHYPDRSLNGVQFEGGLTVRRVGTAVDSGLAVIEKAAAGGCDFLIVHHGLFWGTPLPIVGVHRQAVQLLIHREMTLFASHIPLDAHPRLGNNALLAGVLGLTNLIPSTPWEGKKIGFVGENRTGATVSRYKEILSGLSGSVGVLALNFGPVTPSRVCIITGAGGDAIYNFEREGFDTFITGEPRQSMYHFAKENKLNVFCAGHYATETLGVRAVGDDLAARFGIEHYFIEEPTGI